MHFEASKKNLPAIVSYAGPMHIGVFTSLAKVTYIPTYIIIRLHEEVFFVIVSKRYFVHLQSVETNVKGACHQGIIPYTSRKWLIQIICLALKRLQVFALGIRTDGRDKRDGMNL